MKRTFAKVSSYDVHLLRLGILTKSQKLNNYSLIIVLPQNYQLSELPPKKVVNSNVGYSKIFDRNFHSLTVPYRNSHTHPPLNPNPNPNSDRILNPNPNPISNIGNSEHWYFRVFQITVSNQMGIPIQ